MTGPGEKPAPPERLAGLSVFLPCYNEEGNIRRVVEEVLAFLPSIADDFEIIIVDDGSRDRTGQIADELAAGDPRIRAVHHASNRGYGGALQSGFRAAAKPWVFQTDGDGQFCIADLARLLPLSRQYDIVAGYRQRRQDNRLRRLNAWLWGKLVQRLLGFRCRDVDGSFKLYRREIFDHVELRSMGAMISAEVLARAVRAGYTLAEAPVRHRPRIAGRQTGANLRVILRAFKELWKLRGSILATPSTRKQP